MAELTIRNIDINTAYQIIFKDIEPATKESKDPEKVLQQHLKEIDIIRNNKENLLGKVFYNDNDNDNIIKNLSKFYNISTEAAFVLAFVVERV